MGMTKQQAKKLAKVILPPPSKKVMKTARESQARFQEMFGFEKADFPKYDLDIKK